MTRHLALVVVLLSGFVALAGPAAAQESDHLACMKVKDPGAEGPLPVAISDVLEDEFSDCVIKQVRLTSLCVRVAKDGADDPIAGQAAAEAYGCYKLKCVGSADGSLSLTDQFATRSVERQKLTMICTPVDLPVAVP